jgi:hypothetical protein
MPATIKNTIKNIDGTPVANAQVYITFKPGNDNGAFDPSTLFEYINSTIQVSADVNGFWQVTLKSNGDFSLDNTYYEVKEVISADKINEYDIIVPVGGGTYFLRSVLAKPVGSTTPAYDSTLLTLTEATTLFASMISGGAAEGNGDNCNATWRPVTINTGDVDGAPPLSITRYLSSPTSFGKSGATNATAALFRDSTHGAEGIKFTATGVFTVGLAIGGQSRTLGATEYLDLMIRNAPTDPVGNQNEILKNEQVIHLTPAIPVYSFDTGQYVYPRVGQEFTYTVDTDGVGSILCVAVGGGNLTSSIDLGISFSVTKVGNI